MVHPGHQQDVKPPTRVINFSQNPRTSRGSPARACRGRSTGPVGRRRGARLRRQAGGGDARKERESRPRRELQICPTCLMALLPSGCATAAVNTIALATGVDLLPAPAANAQRIVGTNGEDHIFGTAQADESFLLRGDDEVIAGAEADTVRGGHGADMIRLGSPEIASWEATESAYGGPGTDNIFGTGSPLAGLNRTLSAAGETLHLSRRGRDRGEKHESDPPLRRPPGGHPCHLRLAAMAGHSYSAPAEVGVLSPPRLTWGDLGGSAPLPPCGEGAFGGLRDGSPGRRRFTGLESGKKAMGRIGAGRTP
jgi:hypothetical protein